MRASAVVLARERAVAEAVACPLCRRSVGKRDLTEHHVGLKRRDRESTLRICTACHRTIHALFPGTELARRPDLRTLDGLLADADLVRALRFVRKLPAGRQPRMRQRRRR